MLDIEGQEGHDEGQHEEPSIKDDFAYNNNVVGAAKHIRMGFLRKVYGLLGAQLVLTTIVAGVCAAWTDFSGIVRQHPSIMLALFFSSMALLLALHVKRRETPVNFILLAAFTIVEALTVGVVVSFYDAAVVVQAVFLTAAVVVGLTLYTFQTKRDFSGWGAGLLTGLIVLILGGFMFAFVGGSGGDVAQVAMAVGGALLFSAFIVFDTQMIMKRVSPEEYILATIELYLDIINLFIEILKILDKVNRK